MEAPIERIAFLDPIDREMIYVGTYPDRRPCNVFISEHKYEDGRSVHKVRLSCGHWCSSFDRFCPHCGARIFDTERDARCGVDGADEDMLKYLLENDEEYMERLHNLYGSKVIESFTAPVPSADCCNP